MKPVENSLAFSSSVCPLQVTRLNATGVLQLLSSLHLAVSSTDVGEWQPLLRVFDVSRQLPVEVHGRAVFDGNVSGRFSQPTVAGHIEFTNFDTLMVPRTLSGAPVAPHGVPAAEPIGIV